MYEQVNSYISNESNDSLLSTIWALLLFNIAGGSAAKFVLRKSNIDNYNM